MRVFITAGTRDSSLRDCVLKLLLDHKTWKIHHPWNYSVRCVLVSSPRVRNKNWIDLIIFWDLVPYGYRRCMWCCVVVTTEDVHKNIHHPSGLSVNINTGIDDILISNLTRLKIYRCDSDKAAMVAHDHVTSKCQKKSQIWMKLWIYI